MSIKKDLDALSMTGASSLEPIITILIAGVLAVVVWQFVRSMAVFVRLKIGGYHEREEVYLNGVSAVITKIGLLTTTFLILNGGQQEGSNNPIMRWMCMSNLSLDGQKIERISLKPSRLIQKEDDS